VVRAGRGNGQTRRQASPPVRVASVGDRGRAGRLRGSGDRRPGRYGQGQGAGSALGKCGVGVWIGRVFCDAARRYGELIRPGSSTDRVHGGRRSEVRSAADHYCRWAGCRGRRCRDGGGRLVAG